MKIEVLNMAENECEFRILEEGHTLMSLLRKELFKDPSVIHTGYMIKHPLIKEVRFFIKTKPEKPPVQALKDALKNIDGIVDEFQAKFEDAM